MKRLLIHTNQFFIAFILFLMLMTTFVFGSINLAFGKVDVYENCVMPFDLCDNSSNIVISIFNHPFTAFDYGAPSNICGGGPLGPGMMCPEVVPPIQLQYINYIALVLNIIFYYVIITTFIIGIHKKIHE